MLSGLLLYSSDVILSVAVTKACLFPQRSDYINASFMDGYKQKNAYIGTQGTTMSLYDITSASFTIRDFALVILMGYSFICKRFLWFSNY